MHKNSPAPKQMRKRIFNEIAMSEEDTGMISPDKSFSSPSESPRTGDTSTRLTFEEKMLKKTEEYTKKNKLSEDLILKHHRINGSPIDIKEYLKKNLPVMFKDDFDTDSIEDPPEPRSDKKMDLSLFCTQSDIEPTHYMEPGVNVGIDKLKESHWELYFNVPADLPEIPKTPLSYYLKMNSPNQLLVSVISMFESGLKVKVWDLVQMICSRISRQPYLVPIYRTLYPFLQSMRQMDSLREAVLSIAKSNLLDNFISYIARDSIVRQTCFYPDSPFYEGPSSIALADSIPNLDTFNLSGVVIPHLRLPVDATLLRIRFYVAACVAEYKKSLNSKERFTNYYVKHVVQLLYTVITPSIGGSDIERLWRNFQKISSVITEFYDFEMVKNALAKIEMNETEPGVKCAKMISFCVRKQILPEMLLLLHQAGDSDSAQLVLDKAVMFRTAYEINPLCKLKINLKYREILLNTY